MKKRSVKVLSLVLALIMMLSLCPLEAFATGNEWGWGNWWDQAEGPEMPAQQLKATDSATGVSVTVDAPEGALPQGTELNVKAVSLSAVQTIVDSTDGIGGTIVAAEDITFYYEGSEIEPEKNVSVTLASDAISNTLNPTVLHLDCSAEEIESGSVPVEVMGSGTSFSSKDFSVYAVSGNASDKYLNVKFYTSTDANAEPISQQVINLTRYGNLSAEDKEAKVLVFDPGVPTLTSTQSFEGWADSKPFTEASKGWSVDEINAEVKANYTSYSNDQTLSYYAKVYEVRYVVYHDQAGAVLMTQAFHVTKSGETVQPANVKINWPYVGFKGGQNFAGWVSENAIQKDGNDLLLGDYPLYKENVGTIYQNDTTYALSDTLQLYPYLNSGHWLIFDTYKDQDADGTSTTFISPDFYEEGAKTVAPENPERVGYEFKGWFYPTYGTDGKINGFGDRFVFGSVLNEDTTLVAKWEAKNTTYRISVWQQLSTDTVDNNNLNNEYAYYAPTTVDVILTAKTGTQVSLAEAYKLLGNQNDSTTDWGEMGYYFVFNEARSNKDNNGGTVTVKGDGSTVLNAYYDRKLITINFYTNSNMNTRWSGSNPIPAENGQYYYYTAPYETGYYLIGTGPNADATYSNGNTVYYHDNYTSNSLPSYDNVTKYYSSGMTSHTLSNSNTYQSWNANKKTLIWQYTDDWSGSTYYCPLYYSYTAPYASGYYAVGTGPDTTAPGTHNLQAVPNPMVGLYQAPLEGWPTEPASGYEWKYVDAEDGKTYGITLRDCFDIPDNTHTTEWNIYAVSTNYTYHKTIHWMCEELDGSFKERTTSDLGYTSSQTQTQYYDDGKFLGFKAYGHNLTTNDTSTSNGFTAYTKDAGISSSNAGANAYIYFIRRTYNFTFMSNNDEVKVHQNVKYQAPLSDFAGYVPTNGQEGYFFDGWYADPGCTVEFDFNDTMPNNEVTVYAKWTQIRFRVVVDPRGGDTSINPSDIVIPNGQSTTFRINFGESVDGTNFNEATRQGYTLLGWYLDTDPDNDTLFDTPFSFGTPMTDHNRMADMTYGSSNQRSGVDPWKLENGAPEPYDDNELDENNQPKYANVIGKITVYAKWRRNPDGVVGINVKYLATDKEGNAGKFGDNSTVWNDPNIYTDKAMAFGQPASTPDEGTLQFLYWEILDAENNVVGKAYPGQLWEVNIANAKVTDLTAQAIYVTAPDAEPEPETPAMNVTSAPTAPAPAAETEEAADEGEPTREPTRATHTYQAVSQPSPGKKYLITNIYNNYTYIMTDTYYDNGSSRPQSYRISGSGNTITGDYDDYLFGVEYYNGYYWIGSLKNVAYLSSQYSGDYYPYFGYNKNYDEYSDWTYDTSTKYLKNRGNSSYPYLYSSTNGYFTTNDSGDPITFFELVEDEITTGTDFYRVEELKVGDKVIIAHDDRAMGNTTVDSNSRRLHSVHVSHTVTGDEHVTVPTGNVNTVLWEVDSGDATNGYVLKNVANDQYLDLDSSGYVTLSSSSSGVATWKYDGTDLSTSKSSSYPYLKFSNEFLNFDTAGTGNRDIRLYVATRKYNVTFMDGYNNTQIGAVQQVEEGGSATAPDAPDHTAQGYVFIGWDNAYDDITEDTVVTAQYKSVSELTYTVTFRYMDSEGNWVTTTQTVNHGSAATPPTVPTPPTGYTFNSWDKKYNNITSNLTINAVYKQTATKAYTITLRAVYGRKENGKTSINWYLNDGTAAVYKMTDIELNTAYGIPKPNDETITYTVPTRDGQTKTLVYEDHVFLGWARVENATGAAPWSDHSELNESDLYLEWLPNEETYKLHGSDGAVKYNQVAADNDHPYHDMYAVWGKVFYVCHSGTGVVERRVISATTGTGETRVAKTFDLTALVPKGTEEQRYADGFLYGGYYKAYDGKDSTYGKSLWTAPEEAATAAELNATGSNVVTKANAVEKYDAAKVNPGVTWTWADAYKADDGDAPGNAIVPEAGQTYYIKEVPTSYLQHYTHYTYKFGTTNGTNNLITKLWMVTAIDDNNYQSYGIKYDGTPHDGIVAKSLTIKTKTEPVAIVRLTPTSIFGSKGVKNGYLVYTAIEWPTQDSITGILNYWVTPDNMLVTGTAQRVLVGIKSADTIDIGTFEEVPSTITPYGAPTNS